MIEIGKIHLSSWIHRPYEQIRYTNDKLTSVRIVNTHNNFYRPEFYGELFFLEKMYLTFIGSKLHLMSPEELKESIDKFLLRVNKLKIFI